MQGIKLTVIVCQGCGVEVVANNPSRKRCPDCADKKRRADNARWNRNWEANNREEYNRIARERARRNALANPEKAKAHDAKHNKIKREKRKQDPKLAEEYKAYMASYYQENKERLAEVHRQWTKDHPEAVKQHRTHKNHNRRAKERQAQGKWKYKDFKVLCEASDNHCWYCHKQVDKLTAEHMIPISRGGANTIDNIIPVCLSCNSSKHDKTLLEFVPMLEHMSTVALAT